MKEIMLSNGMVALVDDEDFALVSTFRWHGSKEKCINNPTFYARHTNPKIRPSFMHSLLMGRNGIDHIDGNGLNNQRYNLRRSNQSQNTTRGRKIPNTSSRFKGVCWNRDSRKWYAYITKDGKRIHLGCFRDEVNAATAYNFAAEELYGEYAYQNRP